MNANIVNLETEIRKTLSIIDRYDELIKFSDSDSEKEELKNFKEKFIEEVESCVWKHPIYTEFLVNIPGVDPLFAGYLLGKFNLSVVDSVYQPVAYCGLNASGKTKYNAILQKKILNAGKYFIAKQSPYSLYYWDKMINMHNKMNNEDQSVSRAQRVIVSKKTMMRMFIMDLYMAYKHITDGLDFHAETLNRILDWRDFYNDDNGSYTNQKFINSYCLNIQKYTNRILRYKLKYNKIIEKEVNYDS